MIIIQLDWIAVIAFAQTKQQASQDPHLYKYACINTVNGTLFTARQHGGTYNQAIFDDYSQTRALHDSTFLLVKAGYHH
jgi:hypothetical protein